jgi:hypothetical protein
MVYIRHRAEIKFRNLVLSLCLGRTTELKELLLVNRLASSVNWEECGWYHTQ